MLSRFPQKILPLQPHHLKSLVDRWRNRPVPLLVAMALTVIAGVAVLGAGYVGLAAVLDARSDPHAGATRIDILRLALTLVAGVGGSVALVVAYRRQRDLEDGRFTERFGAATAQLGHIDPAVRLAGIYAVAAVADENDSFGRRQQCIDVLCGYLRLPYVPDAGFNNRTETATVTTDSRPAAGGTQKTETVETRTSTMRWNDGEVRRTIVRVISAHLRDSVWNNWSNQNFDFTAAAFEDADFSRARFSGQVCFAGATFTGAGNRFERTRFTRGVNFAGATFSAHASFFYAEFSGGDVEFADATFDGLGAGFCGATFGSHTFFEDAVFNSPVTFYAADFNAVASFSRATFTERATFARATFHGFTCFERASFSGQEADFYLTAFKGGSALFWETTFGARVTNFEGATFGCVITGPDEGTIQRHGTDFESATFGGHLADFSNPSQWQNVRTDWDSDLSLKPTNVEPSKWPPTVMSAVDPGIDRPIRIA